MNFLPYYWNLPKDIRGLIEPYVLPPPAPPIKVDIYTIRDKVATLIYGSRAWMLKQEKGWYICYRCGSREPYFDVIRCRPFDKSYLLCERCFMIGWEREYMPAEPPLWE